jgi:hypothetical protein
VTEAARNSARHAKPTMEHLAWRVSLVAILSLAACASSRPYDQPLPGVATWTASSPGGYGATPLMKSAEWHWQHASVDLSAFQRDNQICNAQSKTNVASMMFGGAPPIRLYEDCMERLGYRLLEKRGGGEPVGRDWGR